MKILHLSTSDIDGGAARAAYRLHQGLQRVGVSSQMLVRAKTSADKTVLAERSLRTKLGPPLSGLPLRFYPTSGRSMFSVQWTPDAIYPQVRRIAPDLIQLHWICTGFVQPETLARFGKPIVWTLHDMWAMTGGCHYAETCDRYTQSCGRCPQLGSQQDWDVSRWVWRRKASAWKHVNLTLISPSHWLADCARSSALFQGCRIEVIPHGLDLQSYRPIEQQQARQLLRLPLDKQLVLFGASPGTTGDPRKGFQFLQPALQQLAQADWRDRLELVVFGGTAPAQPPDLGFQIHYLGQFHDDISLALVYSAADVMIVPSVQEAYGQTASEALACGTPVVAFAATGLKDIVTHQSTGYLATPFDVNDLAKGIEWVLASEERLDTLREQARQAAEASLGLTLQAERYQALYQELLQV